MDNERIAHWTDCADRCDNVLRDRNTKLDNALCDASNMLREAARALSADRGEAVAWLITWNDGTKKVSFDQCHRDDGTCCPLYAATPPSPAESAEGAADDAVTAGSQAAVNALARGLGAAPSQVSDAMVERACDAFLKDNLVQRVVDRSRMRAALEAAQPQPGRVDGMDHA